MMMASSQEKNRQVTISERVSVNKFDYRASKMPPKNSHSIQGKQFQCSLCGSHLISKLSLYAHMKRQHDPMYDGGQRCLFCAKMLFSEASLERHIISHTEERPYFCKLCTKEFRYPSGLANHTESHDSNRKRGFECELCAKKFFTSTVLYKHFASHTGEKSFKCEQCKMDFKAFGELKRHRRIHSRKRPYKCDICEKRFKRKYDVTLHMLVHTKENPKHPCSICGKKFTRKEVLKEHVRSHSEDRGFSCRICGASFKTKSSFHHHARTHRPPSYKCPFCKMTVKSKGTLRKHAIMHSSENSFKCKICDKRFASLKEHTMHMIMHSKTGSKYQYECDICSSKFTTKRAMETHGKLFHTREFLAKYQHECIFCEQICSGIDNFNRHLRSHTFEAPYFCRVCPYETRLQGDLTKHGKNNLHRNKPKPRSVTIGQFYAN